MAVKCKLKFPDMAWPQEYKLVNEGGFTIYSRKRGEWIIMEKQVSKPKAFEMLINGELAPDVQLTLRRRCDALFSLYADPDSYHKEIRRRLDMMVSALPKHQANFVIQWMDENLDEEVVPNLNKHKEA